MARAIATDYLDYLLNLTNHNMKITKCTSNTTKPTLQRYSQKELQEIAENVRKYRLESKRDYAYVNERGQVIMYQGYMANGTLHDERLYNITKDLYRRGAHKQNKDAALVCKVIGTTIC